MEGMVLVRIRSRCAFDELLMMKRQVAHMLCVEASHWLAGPGCCHLRHCHSLASHSLGRRSQFNSPVPYTSHIFRRNGVDVESSATLTLPAACGYPIH